jgi:hypothetical protein
MDDGVNFGCFYGFSFPTAVSEVPATEVPQTGTQVNIRTLTLCVFLSAGAVVAMPSFCCPRPLMMMTMMMMRNTEAASSPIHSFIRGSIKSDTGVP